MGTPDQDEALELLRERVRNAPRPVNYDVSAGLERHRQLVLKGAALPAWETEVPASVLASEWGRWKPWLGAGFVALCTVAIGVWLARPAPRAESLSVPARATPPLVVGVPVVS